MLLNIHSIYCDGQTDLSEQWVTIAPSYRLYTFWLVGLLATLIRTGLSTDYVHPHVQYVQYVC
jgi:hypothetical protein